MNNLDLKKSISNELTKFFDLPKMKKEQVKFDQPYFLKTSKTEKIESKRIVFYDYSKAVLVENKDSLEYLKLNKKNSTWETKEFTTEEKEKTTEEKEKATKEKEKEKEKETKAKEKETKAKEKDDSEKAPSC